MPVLTELTDGANRLGLELDSRQLEQFEIYYHELVSWNQKTNLTAITDYKSVQIKHFLDSLTIAPALPHPFPTELRLLDVGAGAGFPGLPLKILRPQIRLVLLEATGKKVAFLEHIVSALKLTGVEVLAQRAEEAAHTSEYRAHFDIVTSRAVAELPALLELTLPFCRPGGQVIAQKKGDIRTELDRASRALEILGGQLTETKEVNLPLFVDSRCLVVVTKAAPTPDTYPRRPGIPVKRPLI